MLISVKKKLLSLAFSLVDAFGKTKLGSMLYQRIAASTMANQAAVEHDGLRLSFVVPNYVNWWRVNSFSSKEPETLEWIDGFEDDAILWDIGANVGLYSCYAAKRKGGQVIAFEPSVFNLELLARNVWNNQLTGLVTIVPLPLSDNLTTSTLNMTTTEWGGAMSTFNESYTHDGTPLKSIFEFRTLGLSMDDAVQRLGIPTPHYIKMDVDGIEHLILQGGEQVLRDVRGVLVEVNEEFEKQAVLTHQYLQNAGLVLKEKRHADVFDETIFKNCYNQIWHRRPAR